jgi:hypothetical protein
MFMLGITTFMFALGIIALVLVTVYNCQVMKAILVDSSDWWSEYYIVIVWGTITRLMVRLNDTVVLTQLTAVQYILCDIVCAWRTVVLWNRDKRVIAILLFLILGFTGTWKGFLKIELCSFGTNARSCRRVGPLFHHRALDGTYQLEY